MDRRIEIAAEVIKSYGYLYRCSLSEDSPSEEKVCLRHIEDHWSIFYVERGAVYDEVSYEDVNDASVHLILNAILDKSLHKQAIEDYYFKLLDEKDNLRNSTIRFLVSSEAAKLTV